MDIFAHLLLPPGSSLALQRQCIIAAISGLLSHVLYFIHGVRDMQAVRIVLSFTLMQSALLTFMFYNYGITPTTVLHVVGVDFAYLTALGTSMIIYRICFHRIRHFPGPALAKVSKLYGLYMARNTLYTDELVELHKRYGDIVRVGPNELSIARAEALSAVHGSQSACQKGTLYWFLHYENVHNVANIQDKALHKTRRQVWDQAFTAKALGGYEVETRETVRDWLDRLNSQQGQPMDISLWSLLISFDNMGRVGYSREWGAIKSGKESRMLSLLESLFRPIGKFGRLAWPIAAAMQVVGPPEELRLFSELAKETMDEREHRKVKTSDIAEYLLKDYQLNGHKPSSNRTMLHSESQAILLAATDTVASVMAWAFYYLARDQKIQQSLRDALQPLFEQRQTEPAHSDLAHLDFLNGIIHETMRIKTSVPTGGPRITPPEGLQVGDTWIPGEVTIFTPHHIIQHSDKYFKHPDTFIPERWTTQPDLILDKRAFYPFLLGPFSCVGKQFALMELRMVLANTVWNYDFEFAPNEDGRTIETETLDLIILKAARLDLVFRKRV